jgi:hypothetical protein
MGAPEARAIDKGRAATAEWANARARNRGLSAVRLRGRRQVLAVVLWDAPAHNVRRLLARRAAGAGDSARRGGDASQ